MPGYLVEIAQLAQDNQGDLRSLTFDDIYHSAEGGLAEKKYVFLEKNHLEKRWRLLNNSTHTHFTVAETGFGLGLNLLLTAKLWLDIAPPKAVLYYRAIEKHPLSIEVMTSKLVSLPLDQDLVHDLLAQYPQPLNGIHRLWLRSNICLDLIYDDVLSALDQIRAPVDAWYLDGFSPARNEAMWSDALWPKVAASCKTGTTLSTYTSAGSVRRGLSRAGFDVSLQPGFGRKRDMLCARFNGSGHPATAEQPVQPAHVAIIGGGLAGTTCAHQLLRRNLQVSLFETSSGLTQGASGMHQLAYYPQLASAYDAYCSYSLQAYLYLQSYLRSMQQGAITIGHGSGLIRLMEQTKMQQLVKQLGSCPGLVQAISAARASTLADVPLAQGGLYFPLAGWLDPVALVQAQCDPFTSSGQLLIHCDTTITSLARLENQWQLQDQFGRVAGEFSAVVIANGIHSLNFQQLDNLPLEPVRGQTAVLACNPESGKPRVVLAGGVGIFPNLGDKRGVSATYEHGSNDKSIRAKDLEWLLEQAGELLPAESLHAVESRVGIRCVTKDRHPIAGPIPDWQDIKAHYAPLARNARARVAPLADSHQGLYVCTGFGSHGVTHIPLCADYLASLICGAPDPLTAESRGILDPARFMIRDIKKQLT